MRTRMRVASVAVALVSLIPLVACTRASQNAESEAPSNPLVGVWSMASMTNAAGDQAADPAQPGLFIFTDGYYSAVYSLGAEPRPQAAVRFAPTPEEMVGQYETIIVNTGTYETSDGVVTFRPMVAKSAEFVGGHSAMDYQVDGDVLTMTVNSVVGADGSTPPGLDRGTMTLRRLQ